jgi:hypothetical protein
MAPSRHNRDCPMFRSLRPLLPPLHSPMPSHGAAFPVSFDGRDVVPIEVLAWPIVRVSLEATAVWDGLLLDDADAVGHA